MAPKAAKRSGAPVVDSKLNAGVKRRKLISEAIMEADTFPAPCREMLCALVPYCLGLGDASRDDFQAKGAGMLSQALETHGAALAREIERADSDVTSAAEDAAKCAAEIKELEEETAAKSEDVLSKKAALAEREGAVTVCTASLKKANKAQSAFVAELEKTREQKENFEKMIAEHLMALTDAPSAEKRHFKNHLAAIELAVKPLGLDQALTSAIPTAFLKPLQKRSAFDQLVIEHVTKALLSEATTRAEKLDQGELVMSERVAEVQAAQLALQAAESQYTAASESLTTAQAEKIALGTQLKAAKATSRKLHGKAEAAAAAKADRERAFEAFGEVQALFAAEQDCQPAKVAETPPNVAGATLAAGGA